PDVEAGAIRFTIPAPNGTRIEQLAISPNGQTVVFHAASTSGSGRLSLRRLDSLGSHPIEGTDDGDSPFWSPDGQWMGLFANGKLRTINIAGGAPEALCETADARGGTWNRDGQIVFAPSSRSGLFRVSAHGGRAEPVTTFSTADGMVSQRWPVFLPDQRHFLYLQMSGRAESRGVFAASVDRAAPPVRILPDDSSAVYASGYLLFGRDTSLVAQRFDAQNLRLSGAATPVADGVGRFVSMYMPAAASLTERLVYEARDRRSHLVWFGRNGERLATVGGGGRQGGPGPRPDEGEVVSWGSGEGGGDLWVAAV